MKRVCIGCGSDPIDAEELVVNVMNDHFMGLQEVTDGSGDMGLCEGLS